MQAMIHRCPDSRFRTAGAVAIVYRPVVRKGVPQLLGGPRRRREIGHGDTHDPSPIVGQHDEQEQQAECHGRHDEHDEEVRDDDLAGVIREERPPRLGWRTRVSSHVLGDSGLAHRDAQLQQLAVDPRCTPSEWDARSHVCTS
jgi:hypothetical protein